MNAEINDALKDGRWSTLTRSEANYFIKSGLGSQIFDMTPYVKEKLYSEQKLKNNNDKCDFVIELRGPKPLSNRDSLLAWHPSYDKNGEYKKSFLYKLKRGDKFCRSVRLVSSREPPGNNDHLCRFHHP